jgi:hypothetical protein
VPQCDACGGPCPTADSFCNLCCKEEDIIAATDKLVAEFGGWVTGLNEEKQNQEQEPETEG